MKYKTMIAKETKVVSCENDQDTWRAAEVLYLPLQ